MFRFCMISFRFSVHFVHFVHMYTQCKTKQKRAEHGPTLSWYQNLGLVGEGRVVLTVAQHLVDVAFGIGNLHVDEFAVLVIHGRVDGVDKALVGSDVQTLVTASTSLWMAGSTFTP